MSGYWDIVVPEASTNEVLGPSAEIAHATGAELLSNTGFETAGAGGADVFANWSESAGDGSITDSATAYLGSHACQLTAGASANTKVYQDVTVTAGKMYLVDFYVRGDGTDDGRYRIYDQSNLADIIAITETGQTAASYTNIEVAFIAPSGCSTARITLFCPTTNGQDAWFDTVSIAECHAGPIQHDAAVSRSTSYSCFGIYSYHLVTSSDNEGMQLALEGLSNAIHYVTVRVYGVAAAADWDWSLDDSTYTNPTKLADLEDDWDLYGLNFAAAQANGSTALYIRQDGATSLNIYIDGVQVEQNDSYRTTYIDGTRDGCEWDGEPHNSSSTRSAQSRAGGRVRDLEDTYDFYVEQSVGIGVPGMAINERSYALLPGAEYDRMKVRSRTFTLIGRFKDSTQSRATLHATRESFWNVIKPDAHPNEQPFILQYTGTGSTWELPCRYVGGMGFGKPDGNTERVPLQLHAEQPFWNAAEQEFATSLDTNDSGTTTIIAGRIDEAWSGMGPPDAAGTYVDIRAICVASDNTVYIGGDFQNWDNDASSDYIVKYKDGAYSALQSGLSSVVYAIYEGPDGTIYVGGNFTNAGGSGADYITSYDPDADTFGKTGTTQPSSIVYAIVMGLDGTLYIGGAFVNLVDADGDCISSLAPGDADWTSLDKGLNNTVEALATAPDGDIWAGGLFTQDGNATAMAYVCYWDGSSFTAGANELNQSVKALAIAADGTVYAGGNFTQDGDGNTLNYAARTDGTIWEGLGENDCDAVIHSVVIGPDDIVYLSGSFTTFDGLTTTDRTAGWNGSSAFHLDINLPGSPFAYAIATSPADPVVTPNYDLYVGFSTDGTSYYSGTATVTNGGTRTVYPRIVIKRSSGTTATLYSVRNETTGKQLWFDYELLDGEELTIDLRPGQKAVTSDFAGNRLNAVLEGSDFATFGLQPGSNTISAFVDTSGSPTITAYCLWDELYWGAD